MAAEDGQGASTADSSTPVGNDSNAQGQTGTGANAIADALNKAQEFIPPPGISDYAAGMLKSADEAIRPHLAPLLQEWDKGFQAQVEKQVKALVGEGFTAEQAREALDLAQNIRSNPKAAIEYIQRMENGEDVAAEPDTTNDLSTEEQDLIESLPPAIRDRFKKLDDIEKIVSILADEKINERTTKQEQADIAEYQGVIDSLLETQKTKLGDSFIEPDMNIINQLVSANNGDPDVAVQQYYDHVQAAAAKMLEAHNNAPKVLGGSGAVIPVPSGGKSVTEMTKSERVAFVAKYAAALNKDT